MFRRTVRAVSWIAWGVVLFGLSPGPMPGADSKTDANSGWEMDRPGRFQPKRDRTEADEDRLQATVLFAQGRILFQRQDYPGALRSYQRAHRRDPSAAAVLQEIVPLAFELKRTEEAARYAVLAAERDPRDPELLVQLAGYLVGQKEHRRALAMFTRALALENEPSARTVLIRLEAGRLHFLLGEFADATRSFAFVRAALEQPARFELNEQQRKVILEHPERLYSLFGEAALRAEQWEEATRCFERANGAKKNDGLLAYQLARVDLERKDWGRAIERLLKYLDANLSEAATDPYSQLERALGQKHADPDEAHRELVRTLRAHLDRFPSNIPLAFFLAEKHRKRKEYALAEPILKALRKRHPAVDLFESIVEMYLEQGDDAHLLDSLVQFGSTAGPLDSLGELLARIVADRDRVDRLLELAKGRTQEDGVAQAAAQIAVAAKQFDAAESWFAAALESPSAPRLLVLTTWGLTMFSGEQPERAARIFRRVIDEKLKPEDNPTYLNYLASALVMSNQFDDALAVADQNLALEPQSTRLQSRRAWILYRAQRYEEAERAFRELLAAHDNDFSAPEIRDVMRETRLSLSNLAVVTKRLPEAEEWLEQVLDEFPEDTSAFNDLGYLWADQGKHLLRAQRMIERAVADEPENKAYRDSLGWVLFRLGRYEQALLELRKAVDAGHPDGVVLDHLGDCHEKTNNIAEARDCWRKALVELQKDRDPERANAVEAKLKAR